MNKEKLKQFQKAIKMYGENKIGRSGDFFISENAIIFKYVGNWSGITSSMGKGSLNCKKKVENSYFDNYGNTLSVIGSVLVLGKSPTKVSSYNIQKHVLGLRWGSSNDLLPEIKNLFPKQKIEALENHYFIGWAQNDVE